MPLPLLVYCKFAVTCGTSAGAVRSLARWVRNRRDAKDPKKRAEQLAKKQDARSLLAQQRIEAGNAIKCFVTGTLVGTAGLTAYLVTGGYLSLGQALTSQAMASVFFSPLYGLVLTGKSDVVARHVPAALVATALATGGFYLGLSVTSELMPSPGTDLVLQQLQYCALTAGLGVNSFFTFVFANRYALGVRTFARGSSSADPCAGLGSLVLQILGIMTASMLMRSALSVGTVLTVPLLQGAVTVPKYINWPFIDFLILINTPPQPSYLAILQRPSREQKALLERWMTIALLTLGTVMLIPDSPLSWMIVSQAYLDYQPDWWVLDHLEVGHELSLPEEEEPLASQCFDGWCERTPLLEQPQNGKLL